MQEIYLTENIFFLAGNNPSQNDYKYPWNKNINKKEMGFIFSKLFNSLISKRDVRILMVGLDAAGKTSILYQMKMAELVKTIPTIGFNVEQLDYKGLRFTIWDVGGQDKIRVLWKHYYQNSDGIIFVVDSNDKERFEIVRETLLLCLNEEELKDAALLVFANKQDLNGAASPSELTKVLELGNLKNRKWLVQGSSALTGQGLKEGLDWLANALLHKK